MQGNLTEQKSHGEDHPNVNHFDVGRGGKGLRDSGKTEKMKKCQILLIAQGLTRLPVLAER